MLKLDGRRSLQRIFICFLTHTSFCHHQVEVEEDYETISVSETFDVEEAQWKENEAFRYSTTFVQL